MDVAQLRDVDGDGRADFSGRGSLFVVVAHGLNDFNVAAPQLVLHGHPPT